jgi:anti-sigma factor RsiW
MRKPGDVMHPTEREIQAYLDGELEPSRMAEVETHLQGCPSCTAQWRALRAVVASIETLPSQPLQRDLAPAILAAIRPRTRFSFGLPLWATAQAIAAGVLLVFTWSQVRMVLDPLLHDLLPFTASVPNKALFAGLFKAWDEMIMIFEGLFMKGLTVTQMREAVSPHIVTQGWWLALILIFWVVGNGLLMKQVRLQRDRKE